MTDLESSYRCARRRNDSVDEGHFRPITILATCRTGLNAAVNLREELRERVSNFKAHQERLAREREDYAASQIKRMRERS
jgi:hypothetical protein